MEQMKRCAACGQEIHPDYKFCPHCGGTSFIAPTIRCPACGANVTPGHYCSHCGADLQNPSAQVWRICGKCGNYVHVTHKNCLRCGASFAPPVAPKPVKKRKQSWWALIIIPIILLGILGAYLEEKELSQLPGPGTVGTLPTFTRPTRPTMPHLPTQTQPVQTQPQATEPRPTETKPTQPKPTETKPTQPKPTQTQPKPTQTQPTEPKPTEPESNIPNMYRNNYYLSSMGAGYCETLTGKVTIVFVFVDDPTDGWTASEQNEAEEAMVEELRKLLREAESYGVTLNLSYAVYNATIDVEFTWDGNEWKEAAMAQIGLYDSYKDQRKLEEYYEADQVPVVFVVDEPGRSYANFYSNGKGFESVAILNKNYASLRHELCHVFGARDMYFPQETVEAAKAYLPNGIMYGDCAGDIDPLTAFVIGWMDELTEEALAFLYDTNGLTSEYIQAAKEQDQMTGVGTKYYDNGYYTGDLVVGVPNGEGTYYWYSGAVYTGSWVNGQREGTGTMTYDDGSVYTGKWKNSQRNGKGKITFSNGNKYDGQWKDDQFHGTGTFTWVDGIVYKGDWKQGERTGEGTMTWPSGDKYVGEFKKGERHGKGTYYFPNGNVYEGDWVDGDRTGKGTFTWASGSWYTGDFVKNQMTGKGERYYADYGTRYVGDFVDGKRHGYGTYYYADGTTWTGYWENDVRQD